jgi:hypothetical protein
MDAAKLAKLPIPQTLYVFGVDIRTRWDDGPSAGRERDFNIAVVALAAEAVSERLAAHIEGRYLDASGEGVTVTLLSPPRRSRTLAGFQGLVDHFLMPQPGDLLDDGERDLLRDMAAALPDGPGRGRYAALLGRLGVELPEPPEPPEAPAAWIVEAGRA